MTKCPSICWGVFFYINSLVTKPYIALAHIESKLATRIIHATDRMHEERRPRLILPAAGVNHARRWVPMVWRSCVSCEWSHESCGFPSGAALCVLIVHGRGLPHHSPFTSIVKVARSESHTPNATIAGSDRVHRSCTHERAIQDVPALH